MSADALMIVVPAEPKASAGTVFSYFERPGSRWSLPSGRASRGPVGRVRDDEKGSDFGRDDEWGFSVAQS